MPMTMVRPIRAMTFSSIPVSHRPMATAQAASRGMAMIVATILKFS